MAATDTAPLTAAELDALDALNRARTPGLLAADIDWREARVCLASTGALVARADSDALARAIAAALNALPALLAEVRASRARSPFGLAPESYTLEPASPEMRERYGAARGKVAK